MAKKLYEIPSMNDFLKGLEKIRDEQLQARERMKIGAKPFPDYTGGTDHYSTGIVTPQGKHYQINNNGDLGFAEKTFLSYLDNESYPPFSAAELLLESKEDFKIDYFKAAEFYMHNKDLAMKENENTLSSKEYQPEHPVAVTIKEELKEVQTLLEDHEPDTLNKAEVTALLDQHLVKVEELLVEFSNNVKNASPKELPQLEEKLKDKITRIFSDLKDNLKQLLVNMKDQARSGIENKVNDVKTGIENKINDVKTDIHNAIASRVQAVNAKIKDVTAALDDKYQVIEKHQKGNTQDQNETSELHSDKSDVTSFSKLEAEALIKSYVEDLKPFYGIEVAAETTTVNDENEISIQFFSPNGGESFDVSASLNTGEGKLQHSFLLDWKEDDGYRNGIKTLEQFNLKELSNPQREGGLEKAKEAPENGQINLSEVNDSEVEKKGLDGAQMNSVKGGNLTSDLAKQNDGLKLFASMVKQKHPAVYESIYNELKGVQPDQTKDQPVVKKQKVKEEALEI